jgi:hypothetical protein
LTPRSLVIGAGRHLDYRIGQVLWCRHLTFATRDLHSAIKVAVGPTRHACELARSSLRCIVVLLIGDDSGSPSTVLPPSAKRGRGGFGPFDRCSGNSQVIQLPACNRTAFFSRDHREDDAEGLSQPSAHRDVLRSVNRRLRPPPPPGCEPNEVALCLTTTQTSHRRLVNILTIFSLSLVILDRLSPLGGECGRPDPCLRESDRFLWANPAITGQRAVSALQILGKSARVAQRLFGAVSFPRSGLGNEAGSTPPRKPFPGTNIVILLSYRYLLR